MTEMYTTFLLHFFGEDTLEQKIDHQEKLKSDKLYEQEWTHFCFSMSAKGISNAKFPAHKIEQMMDGLLHLH